MVNYLMVGSKDIPVYEEGKTLASRASSGEVLNAIAKNVPYLYWWFSRLSWF